MYFIFAPTKRQYLSCSLQLVRQVQDAALPDCVPLFRNIITDNLKNSHAQLPSNPKRAAETAVYRIALDLVDSPKYRNVFGMLNPTGEQLLHICRHALEYFKEVGYVSASEYDEHSEFLVDCDLNFERYRLY